MKSRTRQSIRRINRAKSRRRGVATAFVLVSLLVAMGVGLALRQNGRAQTQDVQMLDCPVTGTVAHTHDGNCYDDNGNLVCTLPEVERHVHDDSCYSEERALVCGMSEGEGAHWHDDSCYDEEGNLVCGLEETAGHVHDDSCYKVERTLVCGKDEVTEEHQHGPGCFQTVEVAAMPEQAFEHRFTDKDDRLVLDVRVDAPEGALPEGSTMEAEWVDTEAKKNAEVKTVVEEAVAKKTDAEIAEVHAVDITFRDAEGNEVEPAKKVTVTMASPQIASEDTNQLLVHVESDREAQERAERQGKDTYQVEGSVIKPLTAKQLKKRDLPDEADELVFDADQFSVYAVVYTVDFHWEVDGKKFDFSIPGGGSISLAELVETLGIAGKEASAGKSAKEFVDEVERVEFSDPELVWVGKVDSKSTVGELKEANGLEVEYSADLTEEQIAEINAQTVETGDWALISLKPFTSEETLTVTMKNGEVFTIRVTDHQISTNVLTADGKNYRITVTFDDDAEIPDGTKLVAEEILQGTDEYNQHLGQTWSEVNKEYLEKEQQRGMDNDGLDDDNADEEIRPVNLDQARFFDIRLELDGEEVEPKAPVKVEIHYVDGLPVSDSGDSEAGVIHFRKEDIELINEVETEEDADGNLTGFLYMQDSFSDIGTFVGQETADDDTASVADRIAYPKLSAMLRASSGPLKDELGEPSASKKLKDNEDGTYTLSLSVTGAAKKKDEQPKANVLFVMDRSSSMSNKDNDIYLPYNGEHQNKVTYYGTNNGKTYFTLNYSNGKYTYNGQAYTGTVYTRISRLKAEQDAMSILFKDLLDNNKDENGNYTKDNVEISVISFADDRGKMSEGTEYPRGGSANGWTSSDYNGLMTVVNNTKTPSGTNWQDALKYAKEVADAKKAAQPNEPVFVIFLTDGEPTAKYGESGGAHHYNNTGGGFIAAYTPARPDAKAIVDAGYGFYSIFTFNPGEEQTRYLKRLVHYAYTGYDGSDTNTGDFSYLNSSEYVSKYFYNADSPENLARAFDDILSAITTTIAHGNVSIVDGLTTDAMTSTLIDGKANGLTYKVADNNNSVVYTVTATGDTANPSVTFKINGTTYSGSQVVQKEAANGKKYYSVTIDGKEYKMALADFVDTGEGDDEKKELTWDLSAIGTLENQYTYSLETVVWPNQEAYDYVAALNNGLMEWDETAQTPVYDKDGTLKYYKNGVEDYPSIVLNPDTGVYSVLTNTKQELAYSIVSTTNGVETIEGPYNVDLDTPDPMDLKATASALEKVWNINRDPSILYKYLYESKDENGNPKAFDIGFVISRDGEEYRQVHLPGTATVNGDDISYDWSAYKEEDLVEYNGKTFSKRWSQDFSIATGLMLSEDQMEARGLDKSLYSDKRYKFNNVWYYVLETGHDFTISEPAVGYEFDFEESTYHPMLVDGVLMDVQFTTEGGTRRISAMKKLVIDTPTGKSALSVFNTLRGYINVKKKVVDSDGTTPLTTDDTEFTFNVELTNAMPVFEGDHIPWYGINGLYYHDVNVDDDYYQAEYVNGKLQVKTEEGGPYEGVGTTFNPDYAGEQTITYLVDGQPVSVKICGNQMTPAEGNDTDGYKKVTGTAKITQTETLYIANVPVNTHYTIKETGLAALGYQLIDVERKVGDNNPAPGAGNIENGINGEIVQNTETLITYTNKCLVADINIKKVDEKGKGLEGAVFQLKKMNGLEEIDASTIESVSGLEKITKEIDGKTVEYTSAFETTGGVQTIHGLPDGTYRLYEAVVPAGYISAYRYIQFEIKNRSITNVTTDTEDTSKLDTTADGIDFIITNTPGAELPAAGGPGTVALYVAGVVLIMGASLAMLRKRDVAA